MLNERKEQQDRFHNSIAAGLFADHSSLLNSNYICHEASKYCWNHWDTCEAAQQYVANSSSSSSKDGNSYSSRCLTAAVTPESITWLQSSTVDEASPGVAHLLSDVRCRQPNHTALVGQHSS